MRNFVVEMSAFVAAALASNYFFDIGYWSLLVGVLAGAAVRTISQSSEGK